MEQAEWAPALTVCGHYLPALVWREEMMIRLVGTLRMVGTSS
jgi:hypothetical protein